MTRVGLLFSGQGSQKSGMGEPWRSTDAWSVVETIAQVSGHDLPDLLLQADDETLKRTDRAQISTFALEMVVLAHYGTRAGADASVVGYAGHSLGEYSALVAAGILDVGDASRLVAARGRAMLAAAEARPGTMIAVIGASAEALADALAPLQADGAQAWIANLNAPDQTVIAGDADGIEQAKAALAGIGKVVALPVGGAFHSPLMAGAESALLDALVESKFTPGTAPVVANVDARPHAGGPEWIDLLARQLTAPVRWTDTIRTLLDDEGCEAFVEIGPGNTLSNLVKRIARGTATERVAPE